MSSNRIRWGSLAIACLLALPLPLGIWAGLHLRLSPLLFLQALLIRTPLVPLALLGAVTLAFILGKDRWFCRYACPTGALCDAVSGCRKPDHRWQRLPHVHRLLALAGLGMAALGFPVLGVLDPVALFQDAWSPLHLGMTIAAWGGVAGLVAVLLLSALFPYIWCRRLCPLGGLQALATDLRRSARRLTHRHDRAAAPAEGWKRRDLLALGSGAAGGWLLGRVGATRTQATLRPPGSLAEDRFLATCCRCGNCTRACPTHILTPALDLSAPFGLLAPRVEFLGSNSTYCLPSCNACGQVCPTGSIRPFAVEEKPLLVMGIAIIDLGGCVLAHGGDCDRCKAACPYQAITISGGLFAAEPAVVTERCTGCGACVAVCPPQVITMVDPGMTRAPRGGGLPLGREQAG